MKLFIWTYLRSLKKGIFLALLVYVDDIIVTGNNVDEIEKFKEFLRTKFQIKDLGKLNEYGLLACKPSATALEQNLAISNESTKVDDMYGYIKNHKKTIKNGQARTRERKSAQKPEAKPKKSQPSVKQANKYNSWAKYNMAWSNRHRSPLIGPFPQGQHTWVDESNTPSMGFYTKMLAKEAQVSHQRNAKLAILVIV
ncbi:ribonuclease H-like domain-containing protein [Tanacetum coccineum]